MPASTFYINIDDESPLVTYNPPTAWQNQNTSSDKTTPKQSSQSTFHVTKATNATAEFTFVGTGVYVYGSKQSDHRSYAVVLDNGTMIEGFSGQSATAAYKSSLAVVRNLPLGPHTIKIMNMGDPATKADGTLDIDEFFVEFDISNGKDKTPGMALVDDNQTQDLKYSNGWALSSLGGPATRFINDTVHETKTPGSSVTWNFWGSGVQVIGGVGPDNGAYSVQLDGQNFTLDASTTNFVPSHMLFYMDNLTTTQHTLTMTHTGPAGKALTVDYFMAFNTTNATSTANNSNNNNSNNGLKPGAIVLIVVAILLVFGIAGCGGFIFYRRKRVMEANSKNTRANQTSFTGTYGGGEPKDLESGMGGGLNRRASQSSNNSAKTVVDKAGEGARKLGEWIGIKSNTTAPPGQPTPGLPIQHPDHVMVISSPDRGIGKANGHGRLGPESRYSKANSFDEAWNNRDRRQVQSVYDEVDLHTPHAPPAHQYNHQRSLSSPSAATPLAHRRRFEDDYRDSTNSFDPRAPWDPRRAPADYEPSFDDRSRRPYDRDGGGRDRDRLRDDDYSRDRSRDRDRYDPRPAQPYRR